MVKLPPRVRPYFPQLKRAYTQVTRLVAPTSQRLSRLRGGYLPQGVVDTLEQAAETSGGRCEPARPAETLTRPAAQGFPAAHPTFAAVAGQSVPRVAVAELPGGRVLGPNRAVITGRGDLVQELSWYFGTKRDRPREHPIFMHPFAEAPLHVDGRLGVLATRGDGNYYHFMVDGLARLGVLEQCPQIPRPERWYVPAHAPFQRELLALFGITPDQIVDAAEHEHVEADCLVVPGLPANMVLNPPWVVEYLRSRLLPNIDVPAQRRPVYVTRGSQLNNRRIVNEDAVRAELESRGFDFVDPGAMSVAEQLRAFAGASVIVGAHGAGLANIMFAGAGATVVELFPGGAVLPDCYWTLSRGVPGLGYRYLVAAGGSSRADYNGALVSDIHVNLDDLKRVLDDVSTTAASARELS